MAKYVPDNPLTQEALNTQGLSQNVQDGVSYASKAFRALILLNRNAAGFEKENIKGPPNAYHHQDTSYTNLQLKDHREAIGRRNDAGLFETGYTWEYASDPFDPNKSFKGYREQLQHVNRNIGFRGHTHTLAGKKQETKHIRDSISIIDIDHDPVKDLQNARRYKSVTLPFVPRELNYSMESNFVGIATMGRNNPHYHFTGSEDSLEFTIDWFSNQNDRKDVINNCRWLESLTKSDGYRRRPHRIMVAWGNNNELFGTDYWLVVKADYRLTQFVDAYRDPISNEIKKVGLLPQQAHQTITLKRVTKRNLRTAEIVKPL